MGADNHATVVPETDRATLKNPYSEYTDKHVMREYVEANTRIESGEGGALLRASRFALAHELRARDISARAAKERFAYER